MKSKKLSVAIAVGIAFIAVFALHDKDIPLETLKAKYTNEHSHIVEIGGQMVHYRVQNPKASESILLLHGTGSSLHTWEAWAQGLSQDYKVLTIDLPGFGLTGPHFANDYSIESYVEFVETFLDYLKIDSCHIAGNSLGGLVAWSAVVENQERYKTLALLDAAGFNTKSNSKPLAFTLAKIPVLNNLLEYVTPKGVVAASVENVYAKPSLVSNELITRYYELTLREGNRAAFVDRMTKENKPVKVENLSLVQLPTLILWGEEDELIPVEDASRFSHLLPNDTLVIMPSVGHVPMEESPTASLEIYQRFLSEND